MAETGDGLAHQPDRKPPGEAERRLRRLALLAIVDDQKLPPGTGRDIESAGGFEQGAKARGAVARADDDARVNHPRPALETARIERSPAT